MDEDQQEAPNRSSAVRKLNVGCGERLLEGYTNWDRKAGQEAWPLDVPDESLEEIRASHVLEHFPHAHVAEVVAHWVQKLRPGGVLRIAVPDFERVARHYLAGEPIDVQGYTMGGQVDSADYHSAIFDAECLTEILLAAGLERIGPWSDEAGDCASLPISLNLQGTKPLGEPWHYDHGIVAVLPTARFGPSIHHRCCYEALSGLGIPVSVVSSCFWHQHLSEMMEAAIARPEVEYVLTLDFDSMFRVEDVMDLWRLMRALPEADAICPAQLKRDCRSLLVGAMPDQTLTARDLDRHLVRVATGHFGLTLFRAEALRQLPRPWMVPVPNAEGRWADGKTDADIAFWRRWAEHGFALYLAPRIRIGHMVELIVWPGGAGQPVYQALDSYQLEGMPKEVLP